MQKYNQKIFFSEDDFYVSVKEIVKISKPFELDTKLKIMDEGSFLVEVLPKNENYAMRVFLDKDKNILEYYFDITKQNGIDSETNVPFYDDLYSDIVVLNGDVQIWDENELLEAFEKGDISKDDFNLANLVTKKLYDEIVSGTNKYLNLDISRFL